MTKISKNLSSSVVTIKISSSQFSLTLKTKVSTLFAFAIAAFEIVNCYVKLAP